MCIRDRGGQTEHLFQLVPVVGHEGVPQLVQSGIELVDLGDEVLLVLSLIHISRWGVQTAKGISCWAKLSNTQHRKPSTLPS